MQNIPYSRQDIDDTDIEEVIKVLKSNYITQGPAITRFENTVKEFCGAQHAVAVSSATAALHLAMLALDIGTGDYVWTTAVSFVASSNAALYVGAKVDFVDIDPLTGNMDIDILYEKLKDAEKNDKLPKAVVVVHFTGRACDMEKINGLSKRYGFKIIEDAAHAIGGLYANGKAIGSGCFNSSATIFSFHAIKHITTGEGGMVLTNNKDIANKISMLRTHGITRDKDLLESRNMPAWYYEQIYLGYNYRMTDIQAALGENQMHRLKQFINRRVALAKKYDEKLKGLPLILPEFSDKCAWHIYVIQLDSKKTKITRDELFDKMRDEGIGVNLHYIPIYLQPYYRRLGFLPGYCPNAETYYKRTLTIPLFAALKSDEQSFIIEKLEEFLG